MSVVVYHHPFSRAANVPWMLEEAGVPYELEWVDITKGAQKAADIVKLNPMGKLPILKDGDTIVTESAAIALYVADRYAYGRLAPPVDDPRRAPYYRWSFFAPSVIEPGATAKMHGWSFKEGQVGWGSYDAMLGAMESAVADRNFILGDMFSMADVVFGGTVRYMLSFKLIEPRPSLVAYAERLTQRPAFKRAEERNAKVRAEHGLNG